LTLDLTIQPNSTTDFYIYYQPSSTAKIGVKEWNLLFDETGTFETWKYISTFDVTSIDPVLQEDRIIFVTVDYATGKMQTDFDDIRFYNGYYELESSLDTKVDSDYAIFRVNIGTLAVGQTKTINILAGNTGVSAKDDNVFSDYWDWIDGTLDPWIDLGGWNAHTTAASGRMAISTYVNADWTHVYVPTTGAYGKWTFTFQYTTRYQYTNWYFIRNGSNHYSIRRGSDRRIRLYYNETEIGNTNFLLDDTSLHTIIIDRNRDGEFTVSLDGTVMITATENTLQTSVRHEIQTREWWTSGILYVDEITFIEYYEYPPTLGTQGLWDYYLKLIIKAELLYKSKELPGFEPEIRHGCKIGGVLYE
jgi:hypothetical protein